MTDYIKELEEANDRLQKHIEEIELRFESYIEETKTNVDKIVKEREELIRTFRWLIDAMAFNPDSTKWSIEKLNSWIMFSLFSDTNFLTQEHFKSLMDDNEIVSEEGKNVIRMLSTIFHERYFETDVIKRILPGGLGRLDDDFEFHILSDPM
jgi:hypothetical protein